MNILLGLGMFVINNAELLLGIVIPIVVDYANKDIKSEKGRFFITAMTCLAASALIHHDDIVYGSPQQALTTWTLLFAESQAVFKLYFKDSYVRQKLQSIYSRNEPEKTITYRIATSSNDATVTLPIENH